MVQPIASFRLAVAALMSAGAVLSGCERREPTPPPVEPPSTPAAAEPAPAPVAVPTPPAVNRPELIRALNAAAGAYASGREAEAEGLVGRRFTVRQAFGCLGPAAPAAPGAAPEGDGLGRWSWSPDHRSIEIRLLPGDWSKSPLMAGGGADWEAVEGFWVVRPWMEAEGCPAIAPDPLASGPAVASPQTMGLAAVFEQGGSRLGRRKGRPYSFVARAPGEEALTAPTRGYRLVLEGRFAEFAQGRAIRCRASNPDQRPVCIAAVQLDRVAFEDADGEVLSEWTNG